MERERLTRLVQDAASVERGDLAELQALAERFPWFAGAQVLHTVGVQKVGEVRSEETLRTAAAHVPSRTALFDHVHREAPPTQRLSVVRELTEPTTDTPKPSVGVTPALHPPAPIGTAPPIAVEPPDLVVPPPAAIVGPMGAEVTEGYTAPAAVEAVSAASEPNSTTTEVPHIGAEMPQPMEEVAEMIEALQPTSQEPVEAPAERDLDEDPLERQIMESALSHAYDIGWLEVEQPRTRPEPLRPEPVALPTPMPVVPIAPIQPTGPSRFVTRHDKLSFTSWLSASNEPAPQPPPAPTSREIEVPESASDWLERPAEKPKPQSAPLAPMQPPIKKGELDTRSLIDNFIRQQTPVAQPKTEFFTPQQAAKRSLDDKAGMVTETLARVYAKQGNVPKAIEAYRRLALKYPEKSAYFAALQKELEAQLNK